MAAGLGPAAFWDETPRSFIAIMEGASRAAKRRHDSNISLAWHSAAFGGAVQVGKLKKLTHYISNGDKRQQSPDEMLGTLMVLRDMGAPMSITEVN